MPPKYTVSLDLQQWNAVLALLAEAPFKVVAPLMHTISEQLNQQSQPQPANGHDAAPPPLT